MGVTAQRQNTLHGMCIHCERNIHRGMRGWLCVFDDDFADRYTCQEAPEGQHVPLSTRDAYNGLERLMSEMGHEPPAKRVIERTICAVCDNDIAWISSIEAWSDVFYDGDEFLGGLNGTYGGNSCSPYRTDGKLLPHTPSMSFIAEAIRSMKDTFA